MIALLLTFVNWSRTRVFSCQVIDYTEHEMCGKKTPICPVMPSRTKDILELHVLYQTLVGISDATT